MSSARPVFLNLARLRYPVGSVASIGHRVSGAVLVLALPFAVWLLQESLRADSFFLESNLLVRLVAALLAWAAAHHLFAGVRHLLTDVGVGSSLSTARKSAYAALIGGAAVGVLVLLL